MEGKCDLFTKASDRKDIVDFVKEIEKYPCLYDKRLTEYANKVHNRRAWSAIAKKINTTVPDCRDKWRKIRISFMRSLKQQNSNKPPMRPYYLSEELHFLRPFLKINPKSPDNKDENQKDENMDYAIPVMQKQDISDSDSSDQFDLQIVEDDPEINRVTFKDSSSIIKEKPKEEVYVKQTPRNEYIHDIPQGRNSYSDDIETNPRKMFLMSLLPDIESFTEPEMRIFRREVITICDRIISKRIRN